MFSSARHASPSRKSPENPSAPSSAPSSPSALADSALSNLRKSLASQRQNGNGSTQHLRKSTLEERLRASLSSGEGSPSPTDSFSASPQSIPLPESPILLPTATAEPPLDLETVSLVEETPDVNYDSPLDSLQERLKLVEKRFNDVSASFKRLQGEKDAADAVVRQLTSLQTVHDTDGLKKYLESTAQAAEQSSEELKRLNTKLQAHEGRLEELRDTHRLESRSRSEQIDLLRRQLEETESLLKASQATTGASEQHKAENARLVADLEKANVVAKDEEEKRVKAVSLLKSVRQKLVKAEKEKEDALKELQVLQGRDMGDKERDQVERDKLLAKIDAGNAEREKMVHNLRIQFDKETSTLKDRHEKELAALKGQLELEVLNAQTTYGKETAAKAAHISRLEDSINSLTRDKNNFFDQLQLRQAELESSQSHLESLQGLVTELQYQLHESQDRVALLNEELSEARNEREARQVESSTSSEKVAQLISNTETKYEARLADLRRTLLTAEKERTDSEAEWSRKLRDKVQEAEELRQLLASASKDKSEDQDVVEELRTEISRLKGEIDAQQNQIISLKAQVEVVDVMKDSVKDEESLLSIQYSALKDELEETKSREAQLRINNKNLREELRKVQSSAALLEQQRNPGVGYWTSRGSPSDGTSPPKEDEEVNLEYLRNVILQFLEHKEMRPNLIKVLSIILHFTPQETRRLIAKV